MPFPAEALTMIEKDKYTLPGVEIGWLRISCNSAGRLMLFSGRISAFRTRILPTSLMGSQ